MARGSALLLDETFEAGDDRFLDELLATDHDKLLVPWAAKWWKDERPWARRTLLRYLDDGCDRPGHRVLVRRLLMLAEADGDDEVMAHLACAFDRMIRHDVVERTRLDWTTRALVTYPARIRSPKLPARIPAYDQGAPYGRFTVYTRQYLRRRVCRYFRRLGHRDPARYREAATGLLLLYRDDHFARPEHIADAWTLMHVCFHGAGAIDRRPRGVVVAEGHTLGDLKAAPMHPGAWSDAVDELFELLVAADCLPVRRWALDWLRQSAPEALERPTLDRLRPLLRCPHEDVQAYAVEMLHRVEGIATLPISGWLELLSLEHPEAMPIVCDLVEEHVTPDRLDLAQCVALGCARLAPVAELGLGWAKAKGIAGEDDLRAALGFVDASVGPVRRRAMEWLAPGLRAHGRRDDVLLLIDARHPEPRRLGLQWLAEAPFDDPALWAATTESPYPDVIAFAVAHLEQQAAHFPPESLPHLWATALLAVRQGSRLKPQALRQVASRVVDEPSEADTLLPLLRLMLRSVRPRERRAALASLVSAAYRAPSLRDAVARHLPELSLPAFEAEVVA